VVNTWINGDANLGLARLAHPFDVVDTGANELDLVELGQHKEDWAVNRSGVTLGKIAATGCYCDMGREFHVADSHSLAKNLKGCRVGRLPASRHAHHDNPVRVDPRLGSEQRWPANASAFDLLCASRVLVVASARTTSVKLSTTRAAIPHNEKRASIKVVRVGTDTTARVDDHGGGKPALNFWPIEHCSYAILAHLP
jgi:hypothetical protein